MAKGVGWIGDFRDSRKKLQQVPWGCRWKLFSFSLPPPLPIPPQQTPLFLPQEGLNLSTTCISHSLQHPITPKWLSILLIPQELPFHSHYGAPNFLDGSCLCPSWKWEAEKGAGHQGNLCCSQWPLPCTVPAAMAAAEVFSGKERHKGRICYLQHSAPAGSWLGWVDRKPILACPWGWCIAMPAA